MKTTRQTRILRAQSFFYVTWFFRRDEWRALNEPGEDLQEEGIPLLGKGGLPEGRGGWFKRTNRLISTTPALRATPPQLRRGISLSLARQFNHRFPDRPLWKFFLSGLAAILLLAAPAFAQTITSPKAEFGANIGD